MSYAVVKGGLVIHEWAKARQMHSTYKVACIVATIFPFLELLIGIASIYFMRKLRTQRIMLIAIEANDEAENEPPEEGWKKRSRFMLTRWLRLVAPVSIAMHVYIICDSMSKSPQLYPKTPLIFLCYPEW